MRRDVHWCEGTGQPPVPGTVIPKGWTVRQRGRCPVCDRLLSCPRDRMAPHAWTSFNRTRRQVYVEDR